MWSLINPVYDASRKNKLTDQIFDITPHEDFIKDVIKANKDVKRRSGEMSIEKYLPLELRDSLPKK